MNNREFVDLYVTCRFDKMGTNKINPNFHNDLEAKGYSNIGYYGNLNAEFFYFEDEHSKYFILMGSNEFLDWIFNFIFAKKEIPYLGTNPKIKVHSGFLNMYFKIRDAILKEAKNTDKKIVVGGHSLGSALATLAAVDIQYNTNKEIFCILTGTPRVGNSYFKKSFNNRVPNTIRIIKGNDLINVLPPFFFGFTHVIPLTKRLGSAISFRFIRDHNIKGYNAYL